MAASEHHNSNDEEGGSKSQAATSLIVQSSDAAVAAEHLPQAGYTETVSLDDVTEADAIAQIEAAIDAVMESPS
jgi:hypothetical protein